MYPEYQTAPAATVRERIVSLCLFAHKFPYVGSFERINSNPIQ